MQMTECLENDNAQINADMQRRQVQPSKYCPGVIAIAGYDPAVLAIWNLKVCTAFLGTPLLNISCVASLLGVHCAAS